MPSVPNPDSTTRDSFKTLDPTTTYYVFPNVAPICNRLDNTSHGLALYLLQGGDVFPAPGLDDSRRLSD
ncbi:MAG TPA: hypothetical protein VK137_11835 [Planctomycetaceae bacterium]|nr:hypothetical protein [Planctomycetaceae bacterium]